MQGQTGITRPLIIFWTLAPNTEVSTGVALNAYSCKLLQHRPQIAKACKRFFWAALAAAPIFTRNTARRVSTTRTASASTRRQHLICTTHTTSNPVAPCPPQHQHPAPARQLTAPHAHSQHPAPCFHPAHSQLTAPSTGTQSPPHAQQGITTYDLARKRLCAQKYARKQQSP